MCIHIHVHLCICIHIISRGGIVFVWQRVVTMIMRSTDTGELWIIFDVGTRAVVMPSFKGVFAQFKADRRPGKLVMPCQMYERSFQAEKGEVVTQLTSTSTQTHVHQVLTHNYETAGQQPTSTDQNNMSQKRPYEQLNQGIFLHVICDSPPKRQCIQTQQASSGPTCNAKSGAGQQILISTASITQVLLVYRDP